MHRLLPVLLLLLYLNSSGQIDPKKLDSLSKSIDSTVKATRAQQDSMIKYQDSTYKVEVDKALQQNSGNPDQFLTEQKRREAKERQQAIVRIVISVVLLLIGIIVLFWRKKSKT